MENNNTGNSHIAQLLVEHGLLSPEDLQYTRRLQSKLGEETPLIQILRDLQKLPPNALQALFEAETGVQIRLGDMLLELGHISQKDLDLALKIQRNQPDTPLGDILVSHQLVPEKRIVETLSYQLGLPFLEPAWKQLQREWLKKLGVHWIQQKQAVPFRDEDNQTWLLMVDPLNAEVLEDAQVKLNMPLTPAVTSRSWVKGILESLEKMAGHARQNDTALQGNRIVRLVNQLILDAEKLEASDIHIEPGKHEARVRMRIDGVLRQHSSLDMEEYSAIVARLKIMANANVTEKRRHQDGRILFEDPTTGTTLDLRASFFITVHGETIVLRLLNQQGVIIDLENTGMQPSLIRQFREEALDIPSGVIIVTGPTGSGKTTTLYSCIKYLNNENTSIISAEDPVESIIEGVSQCSINPKLDLTFHETLRHIVRQDPDIIVLGEIRDTFSAETAIQAALTGHKVLTTFHTEDSIGGILRLLNMNIEAFLISSTVVCVVAQRLLRRVCSHCAEPRKPDALLLRRLGADPKDYSQTDYQEGKGCEHCHFTGYSGRVGVFEALVMNEDVKQAILERRTSTQIRQISVESSNLITLLEDGLVKAATGQTTLNEILRQLPRLHPPRPLSELKRLCGTANG